jgi:hypothetical protein
MRVVFSGAAGGSGTATLQLAVDHRFGPTFDRVVFQWPGVGVSGLNVEFRVESDERDTYVFHRNEEWGTRDELVLLWTDPDASDRSMWTVEVELLAIT